MPNTEKKETVTPDVIVVDGEMTEMAAPAAAALPPAAPAVPDLSEEIRSYMEHAPIIDEELLEHNCYQLFDLYQKTGNHEVRRLAQLVVQGFAAILGADPREFFPDAPPIRDAEAGGGAPTYPGRPGQGWPEAQHQANSGGFVPTQPIVNSNGQPSMPVAPINVPMPAATGQVHQQNPSGAEMRVVSDPNGSMPGQAEPGGAAQAYPVPDNRPGQPKLRRRRHIVR